MQSNDWPASLREECASSTLSPESGPRFVDDDGAITPYRQQVAGQIINHDGLERELQRGGGENAKMMQHVAQGI